MSNKHRHYILDIGNYSLKLLYIDTRKKIPLITVARSFALTFSIPEEVSLKGKKEKLSYALKHLFEHEPRSARRNISVILSDNTIFSRFVTLPNIPRSKLKKIISFEAEQQIPFMINEVSWSYSVIPLSNTSDLSVMIAAIRNKEIEQLVEVFESLQITIKTFGVTHLALVNLVRYCGLAEKNVLVINMGDMVTNIIFIEGEKTWGRNILIGGSKLTQTLSERLSISYVEAEKRKQNIVLFADPEKRKAHTSSLSALDALAYECAEEFFATLLQEIQRTIAFYQSSSPTVHLQQMVLCGGCASLRGIDARFSQSLELPVSFINLFGKIQTADAFQGRLEKLSTIFASAIGFGLEPYLKDPLTINLLPQHEKDRRALESFKNYSLFIVIITLAFLLLFTFFGLRSNIIFKRRIQELQHKLTYYQQCYTHSVSLQKQIHTYRERIERIASTAEKKRLLYKCLQAIEKCIPDNIWLLSLRITNDNACVIEGVSTGTLQDIHYLKTRLEESAIFSGVTIHSANIVESDGTKKTSRRTFVLHMLIHEE